MEIFIWIITFSFVGLVGLGSAHNIIYIIWDVDLIHIIKKKLNKLNNFKPNQNKMKTKYLMQAMRFACLPTLSVLMLLFFGFFSISRTLAFISSNEGLAIAIRVVLFIAEVVLVYIMYKHYEKEDIRIQTGCDNNGRSISGRKNIYEIFGSEYYDSMFKVYNTNNEDIITVERIIKK